MGLRSAAGPGRLHRPPPDAGLPRGRIAASGCLVHESVRLVPRTDVRPFPGVSSIPASTAASADPCRVRPHLAAVTVGCPDTPGRSPRIRAPASSQPAHCLTAPWWSRTSPCSTGSCRLQPRMRFVLGGTLPRASFRPPPHGDAVPPAGGTHRLVPRGLTPPSCCPCRAYRRGPPSRDGPPTRRSVMLEDAAAPEEVDVEEAIVYAVVDVGRVGRDRVAR